MGTWLLSMFSLQSILSWLAQKAGIIGALSLYRFHQLVQDNPGIVKRFEQKQDEANAAMHEASGSDKLKWVVESILLEMGEVGNDTLKALLYGFSTVLWAETSTPGVVQQPELPPVNIPVR